jgi:hypothetical protein
MQIKSYPKVYIKPIYTSQKKTAFLRAAFFCEVKHQKLFYSQSIINYKN